MNLMIYHVNVTGKNIVVLKWRYCLSYLMYNCVGTRTYLLILVKADKIKVRKPLRNVLYAMAFDQFLKNLLIT